MSAHTPLNIKAKPLHEVTGPRVKNFQGDEAVEAVYSEWQIA